MRRIKILLYWFFKSRNNVTLTELIQFLFKPRVKTLSDRYVKGISDFSNQRIVSFYAIPQVLYWPKEYSAAGVVQVATETFDRNDWHYYQKDHTQIIPGEVLVDIGAAEGLFTLSVIDQCEKVILIEPNDFFVESLKLTFKDYQDKVLIHNTAIGDKDGYIEFNQSSLSGKAAVGSGMTKSLKTVDSLLVGENKITFLKADIEGFEEAMLRGAEQTIKKHRPKIAITSYHRENNPAEIISIVKSYVPEYHHAVKGIIETGGKPVMIHFWI